MYFIKKDYPWTLSLKSLPAENVGTLFAGIAIFSPVLGFNPCLAERSLGSKEPNHSMETFLPSTTESTIVSIAASTTKETSVFVSSVRAATRFTKSALFIELFVKQRFKEKSFNQAEKPRTFISYGANTNTATENAGGAKLYTNIRDIFSKINYFSSRTFF